MVSAKAPIIFGGPGHVASARFLLLLIGIVAAPLNAQSGRLPPALISNVPVPSELELNKLVWSTMAAVDHANQAGNYSVLRDLAAPGFQLNNDAARLTQIFAPLRATRIDLSNTLLLAPTYQGGPHIPTSNMLQVQGFFGLRPTAISFDLVYQWVSGRWRLFGVDIRPATIAAAQPVATPVAPRK